MLEALSQEQIDEGNREFRERTLGAVEPALKRPPEIRNRPLALSMVKGERFGFRHMPFRARTVDVWDGIELQTIRNEILSADENGDEIEEAKKLLVRLKRLASLYYKLSRPVGWFHRLLYPFLRNPFLRMTGAESMDLLNFFLARRTNSSVTLLDRTQPSSDTSATGPELHLHRA